MPTILLATPHYDGRIFGGTAKAAMMPPYIAKRDDINIIPHDTGGSLLAKTFNILWTGALCQFKAGNVDYFAMLHADIVPQVGWLDILLGEMERLDADVVSAVVPIKHDPTYTSWADCRTSTAIGTKDDMWEPYRILTNGDCHRLPETFCADDVPCDLPGKRLLLNTGCWIANLHRPYWFDHYADGSLKHIFTVRDRIKLTTMADKTIELNVMCESEDWAFSRRLPDDAKVYATRKVRVEHKGVGTWRNYLPADSIEAKQLQESKC